MSEDRGRARGFGADVALLSAARLASVAAFFGVNVAGARLLSPDALGSAAAGQTIGMIAALLANGGVNISTIYLLQQRPAERRPLAAALVAMALGAAVLAMALVAVAAPLLLGRVVQRDAWALMVSAALMGATMIGFEFAGALLLGLGRRGGYIGIELLRGVGSLLAVSALLAGPLRSDAGFVAGLAIGYGLASAVGLSATRGSGISLRPGFSRRTSGEALAFGLRGQAGNLFAFLGVRLDLLLVPALLDLRAAGIYFIAVRTSDVVGQVATAAASLVFPEVAVEGRGGSTALTERTTRMTMLVVAVAGLAVAAAGELVLGLAFGRAYLAGTTALLILLVAVLPLSLGRILAADLKGRGHPGLTSLAMLASVVAGVALDLALIGPFGIEGAAVASLGSYALSAGVLIAFYRRVSGGRLAALVPTAADAVALVGVVRNRVRAWSGAGG